MGVIGLGQRLKPVELSGIVLVTAASALALEGGGRLADAIGVYKEVRDSRGGNGLPSTVVIASTSLVDDDSHISSAASASALGTGRMTSGTPASRANSIVAS